MKIKGTSRRGRVGWFEYKRMCGTRADIVTYSKRNHQYLGQRRRSIQIHIFGLTDTHYTLIFVQSGAISAIILIFIRSSDTALHSAMQAAAATSSNASPTIPLHISQTLDYILSQKQAQCLESNLENNKRETILCEKLQAFDL